MNLESFPLVSFITLLPLFGAVFISLINDSVAQLNAKYVALWTSLVTLFLSLLLWAFFDFKNPAYQFIDHFPLLPYFSLEYKAGVDGLSLACILMTTLIFPLVILAGWEGIKSNLKFYTSLILALQSFLLCTFTSLNLFFFFICVEACLAPLYFLIGLWGAEDRTRAAIKFFLYTLFGSVFLFLGIFKLYTITGTFDFTALFQSIIPPPVQLIASTLFLISFAVKLPLIPFHTWMPLAHVQAPAPVSMVLSAIFLKITAYGLLRFFPSLFPYFLSEYSSIMSVMALISILYASWVIINQTDIKKIAAYSSIAHMGLIVLGVALGTIESLSGSLFQLVSHGFITAGLFLCVGILYDSAHSREIADFDGLARVMPIFAILFFLLAVSAMGMPGTSGFIGEFFILLATFKANLLEAVVLGISIIFTAIYMMGLYKNLFFNTITGTLILGLKDLNLRERTILIVLTCCIVGLGFYPKPLLKMAEHTFIKMEKR